MEKQLTQQDLIDRIKQLCDEKGYDYITLSRKSGVPLTTLLNIIKGNSKNPGIFTISKICQGFEVTMAEFFIK
jgi:transcriptional regulator with XRE-family HTH domain